MFSVASTNIISEPNSTTLVVSLNSLVCAAKFSLGTIYVCVIIIKRDSVDIEYILTETPYSGAYCDDKWREEEEEE